MEELGRLERVNIRQIWPDEARDFTPWLAEEGLEILSQELGIPLNLVDSEVEVGQFRVDLVAKTEGGDLLVIENQFGKADHGHLGKLILYMSNLGAPFGVWIVEDAGAEHLRAVQWLNENTPENSGVYLVKVEAYRIANSPPAPKFTVLEAPSLDSKVLARNKRELGEAERLRLEFWDGLLRKASEIWPRHPHSGRTPQPDSWLGGRSGKAGVRYAYYIRQEGYSVALVFSPEARGAFERLLSRKAEVEEKMGEPLLWKGNLKRPTVELRKEGLGLAHRERWGEVWEAMIKGMRRFYEATRGALDSAEGA